jgi:hypothetical protein
MSDIAPNLAERIGRPRIPLSKIDAVVSEHLGPARVRGNARPSVLYRQIAMYLGKHIGGWSTTRIGHFYHGVGIIPPCVTPFAVSNRFAIVIRL